MRLRSAALLVVALTTLSGLLVGGPRPAAAQNGCSFTLGFSALRDQIPGIVGDCLENEWFKADDGNSLQRTVGGLLVWRKADNWTAFTNGSTTWINGPLGLASRPNGGPLFSWEAPPGQAAPIATPATPPAPTSPPSGAVAIPAGAPVDCGPPSDDVPGPPPRLIRVGQPMQDSWLLCYAWRDIEAQDYLPDRFGEVYRAWFQGYPVECQNRELTGPGGGQTTEGLVIPIYAFNRGRDQRILFTYRIQRDGDYINNCGQDLL
jgi:hypothetical protein